MEVVGLGSILWVENFVAMREFYSRVLDLNVADEQDSEGYCFGFPPLEFLSTAQWPLTKTMPPSQK